MTRRTHEPHCTLYFAQTISPHHIVTPVHPSGVGRGQTPRPPGQACPARWHRLSGVRPPGGRAFGNVRHSTLSHSQPCIEVQTPSLWAAPSVWDTWALVAGGTCGTPLCTDLLQRGDESLPSLEGAEQAREVLHVPQDDAQRLHAASVGRGLGLQRTQQIADPRDELAVQSVQLCFEVCGWAGGGDDLWVQPCRLSFKRNFQELQPPALRPGYLCCRRPLDCTAVRHAVADPQPLTAGAEEKCVEGQGAYR